MKVKIVASYIEITNQCNLNCITCYNRSGLNHVIKELSSDQIRKVIDKLSAHGCKSFAFAGGEPCLHSDFEDLLDLPKRFPDLGFELVTNGTIPNSKLIDIYKTCPNLFIQVSLDGSCEAENVKIRGIGSFSKSMEFISAIAQVNRKLRLKMVIARTNLHDIEPFYELAMNMKAHPVFNFINKCGNGSDDWETKTPNVQQKIEVIKKIKE